MDTLHLATVARRHPIIMIVGVLAGLLAAFSTLYKYDGQQIKTRSYTTYSVEMQMVVVDPGFAIGRASTDPMQPDMFGKTLQIATTYANLATSDVVRSRADKKAGAFSGQITSEIKENSPILMLTLQGKDPEHARKYGLALAEALQTYLKSEQEASNIPDKDRMDVRLLASPGSPVPIQSRRWEMGVLAFMVPVTLAFGVVMLRERTRAAAAPVVLEPVKTDEPEA